MPGRGFSAGHDLFTQSNRSATSTGALMCAVATRAMSVSEPLERLGEVHSQAAVDNSSDVLTLQVVNQGGTSLNQQIDAQERL